MRVTLIKSQAAIYSANAYLIRGEHNAMEDHNVLIDSGNCSTIVDEIKAINTGAGKKPCNLVIITHNHFDHTGGIKFLKKAFDVPVAAFSKSAGADRELADNEIIKAGDGFIQILHTPGHTTDSISIYCPTIKALFTGDLQFDIKSPGGSYSAEYLDSMEKIANLKLDVIYPGHGQPVTECIPEILARTIELIKGSFNQ